MSDQIMQSPPTTGPQEGLPQSLFDGLMRGLGATSQKPDLPPSQASISESQARDHVTDQKSGQPDTPHHKLIEQAIPLPPRRPADLAKAPDPRALADKTLHAIAQAEGSKMDGPSQDARTAVQQFLHDKAHLSDKDKLAVLKKIGPAFEKAIGEADNNYDQVEKKTLPAIRGAKEGYIIANSTYNDTFRETLKSIQDLPPDLKKTARLLLGQVGENGALMPAKEELTKVFKDNPQFLNSLFKLSDDQKLVIGAQQKLDDAAAPLMDAAAEQDRTRLAYERAAQSVGNTTLAKSINEERSLLAVQTTSITDPPEELRKVSRV